MNYQLRSGFPTLPDRIKNLPVSKAGYPIPYFVHYYDGVPDFRVMDPNKLARCINGDLCWICGQKLGRHKAFSAGPLIAVSKIAAEPPSHRDCAEFAAQVCPFMLLPKSKRRDANLPEEHKSLAGDMILERNPGATVVWVTNTYHVERNGEYIHLQIGEPSEVIWYAEGKLASREIAQNALNGSVEAAYEKMSGDTQPKIERLRKRAEEAVKYLPS